MKMRYPFLFTIGLLFALSACAPADTNTYAENRDGIWHDEGFAL